MALQENIVAVYTDPAWQHGANVSASDTSIVFSEADSSIFTWDNQNFVVGASGLFTYESAEAPFYLCLSYKDNSQTERTYYSLLCKASSDPVTVPLVLVSATIDALLISIHSRQANTIGSISFQFENTSTNTVSTSKTAGTRENSFDRTFTSAGYLYPANTLYLDFSSKLYYTVATLDLRLDTDIIKGGGSFVAGVIQSSWLNISIACSISIKTIAPFSGILMLFFGDRLISQKRFINEFVGCYTDYELRGNLNVAELKDADCVQNIPLKLVLYSNSDSNAVDTCYINLTNTFISATGPLVLNEYRGKISTSFTEKPLINASDIAFEYKNYSGGHLQEPTRLYMMFNAYSDRYFSQAIYDTSLSTENVSFPKISSRDYERSLVNMTVDTYSISPIPASTKKFRISFVTEIYDYWSADLCAVKTGTMARIVLTTSNELRLYHPINTTYFVIDTGVTDFDVCQCGIRGTGNTSDTQHNDRDGIWERRIFGFTIFYIKSNAVYCAVYPDVNVDRALTQYITQDTVVKYPVEMPSSITAPTRITVNPLYRTSRLYLATTQDGVATHAHFATLFFGVTLYNGTSQYFGYVGASVPITYVGYDNEEMPKIDTSIDDQLLFRMYKYPYYSEYTYQDTLTLGMNMLPDVDSGGEQAVVGTAHLFTYSKPGSVSLHTNYPSAFDKALPTAGNTYYQAESANYLLYDVDYEAFVKPFNTFPITDIIPDICMFPSAASTKLFTSPTGDIGYQTIYKVDKPTNTTQDAYYVKVSLGAMPKIHLMFNVVGAGFYVTNGNGPWDSYMLLDSEAVTFSYTNKNIQYQVVESNLYDKLVNAGATNLSSEMNYLKTTRWFAGRGAYLKISSLETSSSIMPGINTDRLNKQYYGHIICEDDIQQFPVSSSTNRVMWVQPAFTHRNTSNAYRWDISRNDLLYSGWIPIAQIGSN